MCVKQISPFQVSAFYPNPSVNIDNGLVNGVIFVDLKKAFDTTDHNNIVKKLGNYVVDSKILMVISFFHNI